MLLSYIKEIEKLVTTASEIIRFEVIRNNIRETELETILLYRFKIVFQDASTLELTERIIERANKLSRTKYSYHYQDKDGILIKRWDNAPHHNEISTFPHHIHISMDQVIEGAEISGLDILRDILTNSKLSNDGR